MLHQSGDPENCECVKRAWSVIEHNFKILVGSIKHYCDETGWRNDVIRGIESLQEETYECLEQAHEFRLDEDEEDDTNPT